MIEETPQSSLDTNVERVLQEPTPLIQIPRFCADFGNSNLWIKDESERGSWKQRKALYVAEQVKKRGVTKVVVITAGNAGFAIAEQLRPKGIPVVSIVDSTTSDAIKNKLKTVCHKVIEQDLSKRLEEEEVIALAREAPEEVIWDVTNGCEAAYEPIIDEIMEQTKGVSPEYIFIPFGQGEAYKGLADALEKHGLATTGHERRTRIVAVRPKNATSPADKLNAAHTPAYADVLHESFFGNDGNMAMEKISDEDIEEAYRYASQYIRTSPSSSIVFSRLVRNHFYHTYFKENRNPRRPSIIINSGGE